MSLDRFWPAILATGLAACAASGTVGTAGGSVGGGVGLHVSSPPKYDAEREAERTAEELWPTAVVECGDSYFAILRLAAVDGLRLHQFRNVGFSVHADEGTESEDEDRLHWRTTMTAESMRWRRLDRTWSDWIPAGEVANVPLNRAALMEAGFAAPPDCSDLPQR